MDVVISEARERLFAADGAVDFSALATAFNGAAGPLDRRPPLVRRQSQDDSRGDDDRMHQALGRFVPAVR